MYKPLPRQYGSVYDDYGSMREDHVHGYASSAARIERRQPEPIGPADTELDDKFRMYHFKVHQCKQTRPHDWTNCSYTHPGETARRRDLYIYPYSGDPCPDHRWNGSNRCPRGDECDFAHGVFEVWLHPDNYHTRICEDGIRCKRIVCFFAHTLDQLRMPGQEDFRPVPPASPPTLQVASLLKQRRLSVPSEGNFKKFPPNTNVRSEEGWGDYSTKEESLFARKIMHNQTKCVNDDLRFDRQISPIDDLRKLNHCRLPREIEHKAGFAKVHHPDKFLTQETEQDRCTIDYYHDRWMKVVDEYLNYDKNCTSV